MTEVLEVKPIDLLRLQNDGSADSIPVASTNVVYSRSFLLPKNSNFGFGVKFTSAGTVDVKVELEQSAGRPATELASDADFVVPDDKVDFPVFPQVTDELLHLTAYAPDVMPIGRLKFTGQGSNAASTAVEELTMFVVRNS